MSIAFYYVIKNISWIRKLVEFVTMKKLLPKWFHENGCIRFGKVNFSNYLNDDNLNVAEMNKLEKFDSNY